MFKALTLAPLALAMLIAFVSEDANGQLVQGYPDAIVCDVPDGKQVAFLHQVEKDGTAIFMALSGQFATWKKDGTVWRNNKPSPNCKPRSFSK